MTEELLTYNRKFVEEKQYTRYAADKYPRMKLAILTCMDTRLVELLPAALGLRNGDVKMIKNAGAVVSDPYDSTVRSLLVAIAELGVQEILVVGHTDCGVEHMDGQALLNDLMEHGVTQAAVDEAKAKGVDLVKWLSGFDSVEQSVRDTVAGLKAHPLIPKDVTIRGGVMDTVTGGLTLLV